jgi:hypothetical protein
MKTTSFSGQRYLLAATLLLGCGGNNATESTPGTDAGATQADLGGAKSFVCTKEAKLPGWGTVDFDLQGDTLTPEWGYLFDDSDLLLPSMVSGDILVVGRANNKVVYVVTVVDPRPYHCAGAPQPGTGDCSGMSDSGTVNVDFTGDFIGSQGFPKLKSATFEFYTMGPSVPDTTPVTADKLPILMEGATKIADVPGADIAPYLCSN